MRSILLGACSALVAGLACAQTVPSHEQLAQSQSLMWLNVKGGQFQSLVVDSFDSPVEIKMELTLERANPHPKWVPGSSVCVVDKSSDHQACVRIAAYNAEADGVYAYKTFHKTTDGRTTMLTHEPIAGQFKMGSKIRVAVRSGADSVEFKVEDGAWLMQALPFTPHALRLLCSSALCKLRLNENTAAPPGA
ncbi:hypothetical protein [Massilia sp. SYSU DXS3249]